QLCRTEHGSIGIVGARVVAVGQANVAVGAVVNHDQARRFSPRLGEEELTRPVEARIAGVLDDALPKRLVLLVGADAVVEARRFVDELLTAWRGRRAALGIARRRRLLHRRAKLVIV